MIKSLLQDFIYSINSYTAVSILILISTNPIVYSLSYSKIFMIWVEFGIPCVVCGTIERTRGGYHFVLKKQHQKGRRDQRSCQQPQMIKREFSFPWAKNNLPRAHDQCVHCSSIIWRPPSSHPMHMSAGHIDYFHHTI